ncbi:MAG: endonuclease/exonuclease/phosphatase family protein [Candidatus Thorarchaeota archaeon]
MVKLQPIQLLAVLLSIAIILTSLSQIFLQTPITPYAGNSKTITVASYNIQQAYDTEGILDLDMLTKTIGDMKADIIGLQESLPTRQVSSNIDPLYQLAKNLGYYIYNGPGPEYQTPGVSILSKYPIEKVDYILLRTDSLPRTAIHVLLTIAGEKMDFYSVHLGVFTEEDRLWQIEDLQGFINKTKSSNAPVVVVGDFNDHPNTTVYNLMINAGYHDSWVLAGNGINSTSGYTYHAYNQYERIDYIFVNSKVNVTNNSFSVIHNQYGSDHLPVKVEMTLL